MVWSSVILLLVLGLYYGWRATSNRDRLANRNLRELDRIARTVEARLESFRDALGSLAGKPSTWKDQASLIPDLVGDTLWDCEAPGIRIGEDIRVCSVKGFQGVAGAWTLAPIQRALSTDLFDVVFLADSGKVVTRVADASASGVRLEEIPLPDSGVVHDANESTVRTVTIAGRDYELFLQPLHMASGDDSGRGPWLLGGLVSTARFRAESLALGPGHLVFLGVLLILTILSLPFLRVTLIGPWEHVTVRDVYLLSVSLVLVSGLVGLALVDLTYYRRLEGRVDTQLEATAARLAATFHDETRSALGELVRQTNALVEEGRRRPGWPDSIPRDLAMRDTIFWSGPDILRVNTAARSLDRYLGFQMVYWTDTAGKQVAKWTPRHTNTRLVPVGDRAYFTEIRERDGWRMSGADIGLGDTVQYYVQSLRSKTTGEHLVALSLPFCRSASEWWSSSCPLRSLGIAVILTPLASLDGPVLPAGLQFAVIDPDGRTLFHSRAERILDENFFEETEGNANLRSVVAARVPDRLNVVYMGRSTRMQALPVSGTPLTLIVVLDDQYLGSVHFQTLALAMAMFGAWIIVLWILFVVVELVTPGRLQWAWPTRRHPEKHRTLVKVLGAFVLLLLVQGALATRYPVHPSSVLVPIQALALGLIVLTKGIDPPAHLVVPAWRRPASIGWGGLALATALQVALHLVSWTPGWSLALLPLQLAVVGWAAHQVANLELVEDAEVDPHARVNAWYVASIALTLTVVGLLPGCLFYQEAFAAHLERFVRYEQTQVVEGLHARADRIWSTDRNSRLPEVYDTLALGDTTGLAFTPFLDSRVVPAEDPLPDSTACRWERGATLRRTLRPLISIPAWYATEVAAEMGNLTREATDGYVWTCGAHTLQLTAGGYTLRSDIPSGLWHPTKWWALGLVVGIAILVWAPNWLGRRVFLLGLDSPSVTGLREVLEAWDSKRSLVVVCTRSMDRKGLRASLDKPGVQYVSLLEIAGTDERRNALVLRTRTEGTGAVCLDHFDQRLSRPAWAQPLLAHLERLVFVEDRKVLLLSSRDPAALLPGLGAEGPEGDEDRLRWTRLLGRFVKVRIDAFVGDAGGEQKSRAPDAPSPAQERAVPDRRKLSEPLDEVLERESRSHPFLGQVAAQLSYQCDPDRLTPDALVEQMREMADGYYQALWAILQGDEKLVVAQLAAGVVVNPKSERAIRRLLERNVLVYGPELRLMNESFSRFAREQVSRGTLNTWEQEETVSTWQRVRFPILLAVGAVAAFLFTTQRTTFDTVIAILSTAAVGSTAVVRLVTLGRGGGSGGS